MVIHDSLGPPESKTQMASGSDHPFLHGHDCKEQTKRQTDQADPSATAGRIYV